MSRLRFVGSPRRSLRLTAADARTDTPDLRRTVKAAMRAGGEPMRRHYRTHATRRRRLVLLLDVSGSMEPYARALLRFVHAAVAGRQKVEAFALGTRLTRLTRELRRAIPTTRCAAPACASLDCGGGTRLGDGLQAFNDEWGERGMARGAIVVILSDGWDRGDPAVLAEQMTRLHRVAHRVDLGQPAEGHARLRAAGARDGGRAPVRRRLRRGSLASSAHGATACDDTTSTAGTTARPHRPTDVATGCPRGGDPVPAWHARHAVAAGGDGAGQQGRLDRRRAPVHRTPSSPIASAASATGLRALGSARAATASPAWRSTRSVTSRRWMAIPTANLIFNDLNFRLALAELEFIVNDSEASVLLRRRPAVGDGDRASRPLPEPAPAGVDGRRRLARRLPDVGRARAAHDWSTPPPTSTPTASPPSPTPVARPVCPRA